MLNKLLFKNQDLKQLAIAIIGGCIGLFFLTGSVHYIQRIEEFGEGSEMLGANVLVIQKKVTNANLLKLNSNEFKKEDIENLKGQSFVNAVEVVQTNNFKVWLETNSNIVPIFKTDAFLQSISTEFIDVPTKDWYWDSNKQFVPIIMPRDFLIMLNTFMNASGIPQISDEIAMSIPFRLKISNDKEQEWHNARVIGFTNQLTALLVPMQFMEYANSKFSSNTEKYTQLMVKAEDGRFGELENFLSDNGYEPKENQMIVVRLKSFVSTLIYAVLFISIAAVLASILIFIQYIQLLIFNNKFEVRTLLYIGYSVRKMTIHFVLYFSIIFAGLILASFLLFLLMKNHIDEFFYDAGVTINTEVFVLVYLLLVVFFVVFLLLSGVSAQRTIRAQISQ